MVGSADGGVSDVSAEEEWGVSVGGPRLGEAAEEEEEVKDRDGSGAAEGAVRPVSSGRTPSTSSASSRRVRFARRDGLSRSGSMSSLDLRFVPATMMPGVPGWPPEKSIHESSAPWLLDRPPAACRWAQRSPAATVEMVALLACPRACTAAWWAVGGSV